MKNLRVARRYAGALMDAASAAGTVEETSRDLELVARAFGTSRELRLLAGSPVVSSQRKAAVFRALFAPRVGRGTMEFLDLVIAKEREAELPEIAGQFAHLRDAMLGILSVDVAAAAAITPAQEQELVRTLERTTGKTVRLRTRVDGSLKAGLVVRIGDTVLDASLRRQLELLRARLVGGGITTN